MLVRIPLKYSASEIMGYLKGKSSLMTFEKHANLKYKYGNRHFCLDSRGLFLKRLYSFLDARYGHVLTGVSPQYK